MAAPSQIQIYSVKKDGFPLIKEGEEVCFYFNETVLTGYPLLGDSDGRISIEQAIAKPEKVNWFCRNSNKIYNGIIYWFNKPKIEELDHYCVQGILRYNFNLTIKAPDAAEARETAQRNFANKFRNMNRGVKSPIYSGIDAVIYDVKKV